VNRLWSDFVASWELFGTSYLTGWLIALVLGLTGVIVVAQRQVFLGIATAQASSLGIATALWLAQADFLLDHHDLHGAPLGFGVAFAVAAAVATTRSPIRETADAIGAWIFVCGSAAAVLLLADSPHGLEEVERLMFSTLIGADEHDLWKFGALAVLAAAVFARAHRPILLAATDPSTAAALGLPTRAIDLGLAAGVGLAIGLAMHSAGTLYTFSCLALPALCARQLCRTMRAMLVVAPLVGLVTTFVGFVLANGYDHPPGQVAAAVQAGVLLLAWVGRGLRPR
jgi:manganese/iron transport system permease protein